MDLQIDVDLDTSDSIQCFWGMDFVKRFVLDLDIHFIPQNAFLHYILVVIFYWSVKFDQLFRAGCCKSLFL